MSKSHLITQESITHNIISTWLLKDLAIQAHKELSHIDINEMMINRTLQGIIKCMLSTQIIASYLSVVIVCRHSICDICPDHSALCIHDNSRGSLHPAWSLEVATYKHTHSTGGRQGRGASVFSHNAHLEHNGYLDCLFFYYTTQQQVQSVRITQSIKTSMHKLRKQRKWQAWNTGRELALDNVFIRQVKLIAYLLSLLLNNNSREKSHLWGSDQSSRLWCSCRGHYLNMMKTTLMVESFLTSKTYPGLQQEFSVHNPGALFRKSLSNNIDFLNTAPGVVYGKLQ